MGPLFTDVVALDGALPVALRVLGRLSLSLGRARLSEEDVDALGWLHSRLIWGRDRALLALRDGEAPRD